MHVYHLLLLFSFLESSSHMQKIMFDRQCGPHTNEYVINHRRVYVVSSLILQCRHYFRLECAKALLHCLRAFYSLVSTRNILSPPFWRKSIVSNCGRQQTLLMRSFRNLDRVLPDLASLTFCPRNEVDVKPAARRGNSVTPNAWSLPLCACDEQSPCGVM